MNKLYLIETRSGHKTAVVRGFRLHSAYDPVKEAQRATDSFDPGDRQLFSYPAQDWDSM